MREIGSEFWDVPAAGGRKTLFPDTAQWFLSGRSALRSIVKELQGCHTVALPSWCCDSMVKPFVDAGMNVHFYPVYWQEGLIQEINMDSDVLFLMDYFGYTSPAPDLKSYKGIVIRDVTHSVFSASYSDADYSFGSLRKWCGVWTGGYAWTGDGHRLTEGAARDDEYASLRKKAMLQKAEYIKGERADKGYLKVFEAAEEALERAGIAPAAERDVRLAQSLDGEGILLRRRANAEILRSAFADWLVFPKMRASDCPMFVPVLVPDGRRDALRQDLIRHDIYCPVHWPLSEYHRLNEKTRYLYDNELSLVCDQRYTEEDMYRVVEAIRSFWKGA